MAEYWQDHAQTAPSIQTMMLDSNAEELSKDEIPEILSYLPNMVDQKVVELGAGIGRFTSIVAQQAKHVLAVDFIEEFIEKNKKSNNDLKNIDYMCQDVTKMDLPESAEGLLFDFEIVRIIIGKVTALDLTKLGMTQYRADLVFSNWLFMYLEDDEVQKVYNKILNWLTEDGYVFIRESCNKPSGNRQRTNNPTNYRDVMVYEALYKSASIPCDEDHYYGFDLVFSTAVQTYIKKKNNKDQMVWLLQKVKKDKNTVHGFKSFQDFLDNQQYSQNGILRYEKIFGRTFVSTGGLSTTEQFVNMLNLKKGQKVLDVGGGIGGSGFYMTKKYGVKVTSIDLSSNMTAIGYERAQELGIGPDQVVFEIADATKRDFAANSFDVIYSRDTILHIADKLSLFKRFFKWLKPGGKVLISDYCCKAGEHSQDYKDYVKQRGYNVLSTTQYGQVLEEAGLVNVKAEDKTVLFAESLRNELIKVQGMKDEFIKEFSAQDYEDIVEGWKEKVKRVGNGEGDQRWGLFYAEKAEGSAK